MDPTETNTKTLPTETMMLSEQSVNASPTSVWSQLLNPAEPFNSLSHLFGAFVAAIGTVALLFVSDTSMVAGVALYGASMVALFFFSAATHAMADKEQAGYFEVWDRAMIYMVIAGTYTPIVQGLVQGPMRLPILIGIWVQALLGIALTVSPIRVPRFLNVALYLAMGWTVLLFLPQLWRVIDAWQATTLLGGGISYTIGAVIYALERPNPWPKAVGYHGLWHCAVLAGALWFFLLICTIA